jgi:hypothetical protein
MASFIAPRSDEWEASHRCGRAPLKHEIPRLAYSEYIGIGLSEILPAQLHRM